MIVMVDGDNSMGFGNPAAVPMLSQSCSRADRGPAEEEAHIWALSSATASERSVGSAAIESAAAEVPVAYECEGGASVRVPEGSVGWTREERRGSVGPWATPVRGLLGRKGLGGMPT